MNKLTKTQQAVLRQFGWKVRPFKEIAAEIRSLDNKELAIYLECLLWTHEVLCRVGAYTSRKQMHEETCQSITFSEHVRELLAIPGVLKSGMDSTRFANKWKKDPV